jgi:hypothetical protein
VRSSCRLDLDLRDGARSSPVATRSGSLRFLLLVGRMMGVVGMAVVVPLIWRCYLLGVSRGE